MTQNDPRPKLALEVEQVYVESQSHALRYQVEIPDRDCVASSPGGTDSEPAATAPPEVPTAPSDSVHFLLARNALRSGPRRRHGSANSVMSTGPSHDTPPTRLTPFSVECSRRDSGPTIAMVCGDVDIASAGRLVEAVTAGAEPAPQAGVVLELTAVEFMDSTGIRAILEIAGGLDQHNGGLVLLNPADSVAKLLTLAGIDERIPVAASLEQADAILAAPDTGA